jgi:hypothetical protein
VRNDDIHFQVVNQNYSVIGDPGRARVFSINANHVGMCRYWGKTDPGYRRATGELEGCVREITKVVIGTTILVDPVLEHDGVD